ncbi:hypothetical protein CL634_08490 [bacterium]|nr:hypothetical protein [bacterium]
MSKPATVQMPDLYGHLPDVLAEDERILKEKFISYGDSWKRRGGAGAFMVLARKWDRLENYMGQEHPDASPKQWDIFDHIEKDPREEGVLDDIRDLRRYLALVEAECLARGYIKI